MSNIYSDPILYDINVVNNFIIENNIDKAVEGIIGLSLYGENRNEVQYYIIYLLEFVNNIQIKNACIKALSHIVRIDGYISYKALYIVNSLKGNDFYSKNICDLMDDIDIFYKGN